MATVTRPRSRSLVGWIRSAWRRFRGRPAPGLAPRNAAATYEGAATGSRRTRAWFAPTTGPNDATIGSLPVLRDRSRQAVRNDGVAKAIVDRLVSNLIGTGIRPLSKAPDREFQRAIQALWMRWTIESDPEGLQTFYGQQVALVRAWLEAGEVFVRLRPRLPTDGFTVPLQIQILETEFCPLTHNSANGANRIRAGVEFSPIGQRVAYWMYRQRPGDLIDMDTSQLVRVPADNVIPLYEILRPGQIRGVPHLTQTLLRLYELDQFDDAVLVRQKLANLFVGFLTSPANPTNSEGEQLDPITGQPIQRDANDQPFITLEPGAWGELRPGEEPKFSDPPSAGDTYPDFVRAQLRAAAIAADVPYEVLTGDMTDVDDRTVRVILNEFRRRLEQWQQLLFVDRVCRPIWALWLDTALRVGPIAVPAAYYLDPEPWRRVTWQAQRWPYIQPVQDVEATRAEIRSGLTSLSRAIVERGEDPDEVLDQLAQDNARLDALGLVLDSDPRRTANTGATSGQSMNPTATEASATASVDALHAPIAIERSVHYDSHGRVAGVLERRISRDGHVRATEKRVTRDGAGRLLEISERPLTPMSGTKED